jgi:hypothetical protein
MLNEPRIAPVAERSGKAVRQSDCLVSRTQQQGTGIRADKPGQGSLPWVSDHLSMCFENIDFTLSNASMLTPFLRMMIDCCAIESRLFQAQ